MAEFNLPYKPISNVEYEKVPFEEVPDQRAKKQQKESLLDPERIASARKRLQENYTEAENAKAKKQRKIQVMDIHASLSPWPREHIK